MEVRLPGASPDFEKYIGRVLRQVFSFPLRLWRVATADLPTASTDNEGGIAYDETLSRLTVSTGAAWESLQPYDADLAAYAALSTTGLVARTGAGTASTRTVTGTSNEITVANGDGVSANPTLSLPTALTFTGKTVTGGTFSGLASLSTGSGGSIASGGHIRTNSPTSGIGYTTGAGGTVTQGSGSGKATGVSINRSTGTVTMDGATLNAATAVTFTMTNNAIEANDLIVAQHHGTGTFGAYLVNVHVTAATTADFTITNISGGNLGEAIVLKYALIKSVVA